jgi:hypothetical protein
MSDIFDLDKEYDFTDDVQKNVKLLNDTFGKKFKIKYGETIVPVNLEKYKSWNLDDKFYILTYNLPKNNNELLPFKIYFINWFTSEIGNDTYIANIHRTEHIRGTEMVKLVLAIQRKLHVQNASIHDGTQVDCKDKTMDLTLFKLFEKGIGFYESLGFELDMNVKHLVARFQTKEKLKEKINEYLNKIKKITVSELIKEYNEILDIITQVIHKQDYTNLEIEMTNGLPIEPQINYYNNEPKNFVSNMLNRCFNVINELNKSKEKYFIDYLIKLFKNECESYIYLLDAITSSALYKIKYHDKTIVRKYIRWFTAIFALRNMLTLTYHFK